MSLFTFARLHARPGNEGGVAEAILGNLDPSRGEPGCISIEAYRSIRDPRLFHIYACWKDEVAFEAHAVTPHTIRFLERVEPLIDHPLEVTRSVQIG